MTLGTALHIDPWTIPATWTWHRFFLTAKELSEMHGNREAGQSEVKESPESLGLPGNRRIPGAAFTEMQRAKARAQNAD